MPDAYARITELDRATLDEMATAMELRATDVQQRAFVDAYLSQIELRDARVLEVGCGTGAITRLLATRPGAGVVTGVDPSPVLLARARALAADLPNVAFQLGDGRQLPVEAASVDVVVMHTVMSHVPEPERMLGEVHRVLRPGGSMALFDGDYSTITFAGGDDDPLDVCAAEFRHSYVHDPWVMRRAVALVLAAGFRSPLVQSHGYAQVQPAEYMMTVLARGADALAARGVVSGDLAEALKREGRRRVAAGTFFGHIAYVSVVATKPS